MGDHIRGAAAVLTALVVVTTAAPAAAEDPTWTRSAAIGTSTGETLVVATDAAGNDTAAWTRWDARDRAQVMVARRTDADGWSAPEPLSSPVDEASVDLATTPSGEVTAVWSTVRSRPGRPRVARIATATFDGAAWSSRTTVWQGSRPVFGLDLDVASTGYAALSWSKSSGGRVTAHAATRDPAGAWRSPSRIDTSATIGIALGAGTDDTGHALAVWAGKAGTRLCRWTGTQWSACTTLSRGFPQELAFDVADDGGAALLVGASTLMSRTGSTTGTWGPLTPVVDEDPGAEIHDIQVEARPGGRVTVAWAVGRRQVRVAEMVEDAWVPTPALPPTADWASDLHLVHRGDGDLVLLWNEHVVGNTTRNRIMSLTRTAGAWSTAPVQLSAARSWLLNLRVAGNEAGHLVAVWERGDLVPNRVRSATGSWPPPTP